MAKPSEQVQVSTYDADLAGNRQIWIRFLYADMRFWFDARPDSLSIALTPALAEEVLNQLQKSLQVVNNTVF